MADAVVRIADVVVPEIFDPYVQQLTEEKSRLIASGALARDSAIDALLAGGGLTFNTPSWKDLANDVENVSSDDPDVPAESKKTGTAQEISVRMNRNQVWSTMDLTGVLAGSQPMVSIANRVSDYWVRRLQVAWIATMTGLFADNAKAPDAGDQHLIDDMTEDVSGGAYTAGVTDFTAEAFLDAALTMGDSMEDLAMVMVHSVVYNRMQKNNLIDFIPDARGEVNIPTFLGRAVIIDDGMPVSGAIYETWLFGGGATRLGVGSPDVPTEITRLASAGAGGGQDKLHNRVQWCIHPGGHAFIAASVANGGPSNVATVNGLGHEDTWQRVFTERKQIKIARLITREA